ncbi:helix-turn-helix domain-containing protein [Sphingobacterium sp. DR205]|nr:helix-turn-helix domain-containing protein [Sphingobacterium sp. DR205]
MRPCDMVGDVNAKTAEFEYWQDIVIKKEDMAAYLGISVRSLNRELKKLL